MANLYLIPSDFGEHSKQMLAPYSLEIVHSLRLFFVENGKATRHFLKRSGFSHLQESIYIELSSKGREADLQEMVTLMEKGQDAGLISDAGCPAIADPGAEIVAAAQRAGIRVVPLPGPSAILMALMASGFNGQKFTFHGYLDKTKLGRQEDLKMLERNVHKFNETAIFIETPYRNDYMLEDILDVCRPETGLCVAADITLPDEFIRSMKIAAWRKSKLKIGERPAVFVLGR